MIYPDQVKLYARAHAQQLQFLLIKQEAEMLNDRNEIQVFTSLFKTYSILIQVSTKITVSYL